MSDGFSNSPLLGPMMRAYQLYQLIMSTRNAAEDRKLALEDRQRHIANEQYTRERQGRIDAQTQENQNRDDIAAILGKGGRQVHPGTPFFDLLKPQTLKIGAETYSVPDPQIAERRKVDAALDKHRQEKEIDAEIADRNSQEFPLEVFFPNQPGVKGKTVKLHPENVAGFLSIANSAQNSGEYRFHTEPGDGSLHIYRSGRDGTKEEIIAGGGKTKTDTLDNGRNLLNDINDIEKAKSEAYALDRNAEAYEQAFEQGSDEQGRIKAQAARAQAQAKLAYARNRAMQIKQTYGDRVRVGNTEEGQWPYAAPVEQPQPQSPQASRGPKTYPASSLGAYAKKYTKGDVNKARKELERGGYQILEDK